MGKMYVVWFKDVDKEDVGLVGGKGANLGEMVKAGFPVPNGFIVTAPAYFTFLKENNLAIKIKHLLKTINYDHATSLTQVSEHIKREIMRAPMSEELAKEIFRHYRQLGGVLRDAVVAVRSSATAEDLPNASFAGQQDTYLNVQGETNVLLKVKEAWASLFTPRALFYRHHQRFSDLGVGIAVPVQKMVSAEKSGIMFTIDPVTNDKTRIVIEAIFGLGELIVQGKVTPDHYELSKGDFAILVKDVSQQAILLRKVDRKTKEVHIPKKKGLSQKLTDKEIVALARLGRKLEEHYYFPQDVEWAIEKGKIYVVQTRPVTTVKSEIRSASWRTKSETKRFELRASSFVLLVKGDPASPGIATGPVKVIRTPKEIERVERGDVLVAPQTSPDYVPAMKKAVAIVTEKGGRTSHAAIVSRELGIPAVVGAKDALKVLKPNTIVTVHGEKGEVYRGGFLQPSPRRFTHDHESFLKTATKVYVNLAEPELAGTVAGKNVDGVGLLRAEFIMAQIGIHPKKMIRDRKKHTFTKTLAESIEQFCQAFSGKPVVYRASDFKTNEYRQLVGGKDFEPQEPNPMLGYRGAFRYIHDPEVFQLELDAIKLVRQTHKNLWMMVPYVRSVRELITVKQMISQSGLYRSETFKVWMMVEIPANVILLEKFIFTGIDGVSIGSNDLTMLILGTDRDNSDVAPIFNEQNEAVLWAIQHVIETAKKYHVTSSLCGQAASLYPSLLQKLVAWGITSVSVSPDAVEEVRRTIAEAEKKLVL